MERIAGVVRGEGVVAVFATMRLEGEDQPRERSSPSGRFLLALDDGGEVEVRCHTGPRLGPLRERRGRWEDVEDDALAALFDDRAPGGHVEVVLEGAEVRAGDRVVVEGVVERRVSSEGYRGGVELVPEWIDARRIGVGDDAREWLDQEAARPPREPGRRGAEKRAQRKITPEPPGAPSPLRLDSAVIACVTGAGMVTFGLVTWLGEHGLHVWRFVAFAVGLQLLIASVYKLRLLRPLPRMGVADSTTKGTGLAWVPTAGRVALAFGLAWVAFLALGVAIEAASYAVGALIGVGLSGFVLAALLYWRGREDARALRILVGAKQAEGGGWGLRAGRIVRGHLQRTRSHPSPGESYTDSNGNTQQHRTTGPWVDFYESSTGSEELEVETALGNLRVRPQDGVWGTTDLLVDADARRMVQVVSPGHEVIVLGRLDDGVSEATGPESLFVFGAPGQGALAAARRALWSHRLGVVALVLLGGLGMGVGWVNLVQDHRTFEPVVESSTLPGLSPGDRCKLHIGYRPLGGWRSRCQGHMTCGEHTVYGAWTLLGAGYFDCDMNELTGGDDDANDGDGAIHLLPGRVGVAEIPAGEVRFSIP